MVCDRFDGVIPLRDVLVFDTIQGGELRVGDFNPGLIEGVDELGGDAQAGSGGGAAQVLQDVLHAVEHQARPMLGHLAEQPVLDRVVFRGAGRIVQDRDLEAERAGEFLLQEVFPGPRPAAVAAAGVGENHQLGGIGITHPALGLPPLGNALGGELRRVVRAADAEAASVGMQIVDAIRHRQAVGQGAKVMVMNRLGCAAPLGAGVLEPSDEFFFLGVHTGHRDAVALAALACGRDFLKLLVALPRAG